MTLNPITWYKQISALLKIKSEVSKMSISELKTSEGRLTLIMNIVAIYSSVQGFIPATLTAKIAAFSVAAYAIARALVKVGEAVAPLTKTDKDDKAVAEANAILDKVSPK